MDIHVVTVTGAHLASLCLKTDDNVGHLKRVVQDIDGSYWKVSECQQLIWKERVLDDVEDFTLVSTVITDPSVPVQLVRHDLTAAQDEEAQKIINRYGGQYRMQHHFFWAVHEGNHNAICGLLRLEPDAAASLWYLPKKLSGLTVLVETECGMWRATKEYLGYRDLKTSPDDGNSDASDDGGDDDDDEHNDDVDSFAHTEGLAYRTSGGDQLTRYLPWNSTCVGAEGDDGWVRVQMEASPMVNAMMLPTDFCNAADDHGWPFNSFEGRYEDRALHLATRCCDQTTVETLLRCRADPSLRNDNGETALDIVQGKWKRWKYSFLEPADRGGDPKEIEAMLLRGAAEMVSNNASAPA